jgi:spermidine/putrescine transport system ATP-binding protein
VAFEGNFISVQTRDATGQLLVSEARNDGSTAIPERGEKRHIVFDSSNALILAGDISAKDPDE